MFPYNDEENDWISKNAKHEVKSLNHSIVYSLLFALFSTTLTPLIYFSRTNLF